MDFLFVTRRMAVMNNTQVGGGVRSTLLIEALSKLGHVDVISFVKEPVVSAIPNCDVIFSGEVPERKLSLCDRVLLNLRLLFAPWRPGGYCVVDKDMSRIVARYYSAKHYDFVVCHFIADAVSCGLTRYADRLIIDVDDNLVSAARRDLANARARSVKDLWRTRMIGRMQRHLLKRVKISFCSSESDSPYEKSVFLPNVPLLSSPCRDVAGGAPMRLLFVGNMDFFPNQKGILHFVECVFPIVRERIPAVELHVVGLCKDQDVRSKLCSIPGVRVLGFVDDLQEEYQNCRAVIVPLYHGSGTSVKFIEGVMMNRPVVATPMGARGFDRVFQANRHYLLAKSDQEFADHVVNVLSDITKAGLMAREACEIAKANFSKERFFDVIQGAIEAIIS